MASRPRRLALTVALLAGLSAGAAARDPYETLAREVEQAALQAGARRAQFLPLAGADGRITPEGRMISARLLARLVSGKKLDVVLGPLPGGILEPYLALLDPAQGRELHQRLRPSQPSAAEVAVLGSYLVVRDRIKANVQVVETATGKILYAGDADLANEWPLGAELWRQEAPERRAALLPPAPEAAFVAQAGGDPMEELRDAVASASPRPASPHRLPPARLPRPSQRSKPPKAYPVSFSLEAPEARAVELAGAFLLHTDGRLPMKRGEGGRWTATVFLTPRAGYGYHFLVDGEKRLDPANPRVARGLSVLTVATPAMP